MYYTDKIDGFQISDVHYIGLPPKDAQPKYAVVLWHEHDPSLDAEVDEEDE